MFDEIHLDTEKEKLGYLKDPITKHPITNTLSRVIDRNR